MASKTLLTAVKLELFTLLATKPLTGTEIKLQLCLHDRNLYDFTAAVFEEWTREAGFV